jgi:phosphopantothenate---cysteine ligase (CTP)
MNILVTAGNTQVPIDRVRVVTNIFTGRTGARIALCAHERGHRVTLLTSHPDVIGELSQNVTVTSERWNPRAYRSFSDLQTELEAQIQSGGYDAVIHSAAASDYQSAGIYAPAAGTYFDPVSGRWRVDAGTEASLVDRAAGKIKSDEEELWLRMVRTPKLIDLIRSDWGFRGVLVKFKLEVGVNESDLLAIAERSRRQSEADLMVANTLEGANQWALLGPLDGAYQKIDRPELPRRLLEALESLHKERQHG